MFWAEEYAGESKNFLNECAERMVNVANACAGHDRNGEGPPLFFQASSQVRLWLRVLKKSRGSEFLKQ